MHTSKEDEARVEKRLYARGPLLLITCVLLLGLISTQPTQVAFHSSEVNFTDTSRGGFAIVPASCPSAPPPTTGDGGGYVIPNGTYRAEVSRHGYTYCVTNYTGNTVFVPANTASELSTFFSVAPGIGGMEAFPSTNLGWWCWYGYNGAFWGLGSC